ncbi:MAG: DNA methyltransferase [Thermoproteota archaeon]
MSESSTKTNKLQEARKIQTTLYGKEAIDDWNFANCDTSYLTHGLHEYPARMIPQIAQRLINRYSPEGGKILDPFCGSGTVLVEARTLRSTLLPQSSSLE